MEKFIEFSKKYCLKELGIITIVSLIMYFIFYGKQDVYLVDVSREAYIPWQMLKGKVLYKDIFNVYGPLGYQINAIAYALLGVKLNTLYLMGFLNSLVICFTTFFISKLFVDKKTSLCISGLTMFVCVYAKNFFNFIFVYSYNAVYALSGFLLSLLFALLFLRDKKTSQLLCAFLFAGFSFANKIEDLPYFVFLFLCLPLFVKFNEEGAFKKYLFAFFAFMLFPVISFGVLVLQGVSLSDFISSFDFIQKLVKAPVTTYFYYNFGLYFNPYIVADVLHSVWTILKTLVPCAVVLYGLNLFVNRCAQNKFVKAVCNFAVFTVMLFVSAKSYNLLKINYSTIFAWAGMAVCVILKVFVLVLVYRFFKYKKLKEQRDIAYNQDKMFLFLVISALAVSFKGLFDVTITCYGTFTLAALFIPLVIFFAKYVPDYTKYLDKTSWDKTLQNLCLMVMMGFFFFGIDRITDGQLYKLAQPTGTLFIKKVYPMQNDMISYIREHTPKDAVVLTVPEGAIVNFLAQRDTHNMFYYLIPVNVQIFGEDFILKNIENNPPDYFLYNTLVYSVYGVGDFCSYAPKVCDFMDKNYYVQRMWKGPVTFILYKHK